MSTRRRTKSRGAADDREGRVPPPILALDDTSTSCESQSPCDSVDSVEQYLSNCRKFDIPIDQNVVISLRTQWDILMPSKKFGEGAMLSLSGILDKNEHVRKLDLSSAAMYDSRFRGRGNGNANARALADILTQNRKIDDVNLTDTGLDDDGIKEICRALEENKTITKLNLSRNNFTWTATQMLQNALVNNTSLKEIDLSRNGLDFQSIFNLQCACQVTGLSMIVSGNYVFVKN